jgi:hypothetical protein
MTLFRTPTHFPFLNEIFYFCNNIAESSNIDKFLLKMTFDDIGPQPNSVTLFSDTNKKKTDVNKNELQLHLESRNMTPVPRIEFFVASVFFYDKPLKVTFRSSRAYSGVDRKMYKCHIFKLQQPERKVHG